MFNLKKIQKLTYASLFFAIAVNDNSNARLQVQSELTQENITELANIQQVEEPGTRDMIYILRTDQNTQQNLQALIDKLHDHRIHEEAIIAIQNRNILNFHLAKDALNPHFLASPLILLEFNSRRPNKITFFKKNEDVVDDPEWVTYNINKAQRFVSENPVPGLTLAEEREKRVFLLNVNFDALVLFKRTFDLYSPYGNFLHLYHQIIASDPNRIANAF